MSRTPTTIVAIGIGLVAFAMTAPARANGRFPEANAFFFSSKDSGFVLLRTTFGVLQSRDRGATWDWICDGALGLTGSEDPMFHVTPSGAIVGSTFSGVALSTDNGCSFSLATGNVANLVFVDLASRPTTPDRVVTLASGYAGQDGDLNPFFETNLWETADDAKSFVRVTPSTLDPATVGQTVDLAPSDPMRIYVSSVRFGGEKDRQGYVYTSTDGGKTFQTNLLPLVDTESAPFLSGVHPTNPDQIYVRTANAVDRPSRLLVSVDAGKTYRTVLTGSGPLLGIAFNADHTRVWVGGPLDGIHTASTADWTFTKKSSLGVQCLSYQPDGLWACAAEKDGFIAGLSTDEGVTFAPKLRLCGIRGALSCALGTTTNFECVQGGKTAQRAVTWPAQNARLGCAVDPFDAGSPLDAGSASASRPVDDGGCRATGHGRQEPVGWLLVAALSGVVAVVRAVRSRMSGRGSA